MPRIEEPFLAGFIAGEGHFSIRPNNAGQSWACGFELVQREDNTALVVAARDLVGVGQISRKAARGTSRAQVAWTVQKIDDCLRLVHLLDGLPLLGKKTGDFRIWRTAVARWAQLEDGRSRWPHLKELGGTLQAHRQPRYATDYTWVDISDGYLESFLAGFASAEGHYGASREGHPRFVIKLRGDDSSVLSLLASRFHVGRLVTVPSNPRARANSAWLVTGLAELRSLVGVFDRHPPLGRAGRIYPPWRRIVLCTDRRGAARRPLAAEVRDTRRHLQSLHASARLPQKPPRRLAYLSALKRWAGTTRGPFTAPSYAAWRREVDPSVPDRNTIARTFGSWRAALLVAGIPTDRSTRTKAIAAGRRSTSAKRIETSARQREAVLRSVRRCSINVGRPPAAVEYLRWRLESDPSSPGQSSIYRLFPGGWPAVLSALQTGFT